MVEPRSNHIPEGGSRFGAVFSLRVSYLLSYLGSWDMQDAGVIPLSDGLAVICPEDPRTGQLIETAFAPDIDVQSMMTEVRRRMDELKFIEIPTKEKSLAFTRNGFIIMCTFENNLVRIKGGLLYRRYAVEEML